jgi:hypothetical protein
MMQKFHQDITPEGEEIELMEYTGSCLDLDVSWNEQGEVLISTLWSADMGMNLRMFVMAQDMTVEQSVDIAINDPDTMEKVNGILFDDGNIVVVSDRSNGQDMDVIAHLYSGYGSVYQGEFVINETIDGDQKAPRVAKLSSNGFLVGWQGHMEPHSDPSIVVRAFEIDLNTAARTRERSTMSIYPNPFTDHLQLTGDGINEVRVFDLTGRLVTRHRITARSARVELAHLPAGHYNLMLINDERNVSVIKGIKVDN